MFKVYLLQLAFVVLHWISLCASSGILGITRNPLKETVAYLQAEENKHRGGIISVNQTQKLLDTLWETVVCASESPVSTRPTTNCQGCLEAVGLFNIINANVSIGLQLRDFERASVVLLYHFENGVCKLPEKINKNQTYVDYLSQVMTSRDSASAPTTTFTPTTSGGYWAWGRRFVRKRNVLRTEFSAEQLGHMLDIIKSTYKPKTVNKCFTSEDVFEDIGLKHDKKANENDVEKLSSIVISNLLNGNCIGPSQIISPEYFAESIFEYYGTFGEMLPNDFDQLLMDLDIGMAHDDHKPHEWREYGPIEARRRRKRAAERLDDTTDHHHTAEHISACYTFRELLNIFEVEGNAISFTKFVDMCPALIEQLVSGACEEAPHVGPKPDQSASVFGYATLAVFLVTMCSMVGIIIVPLASVKVYTGIMHLFVALAVSTLSGDALLHLIPEALGLHGHDEHQHRREQPVATHEEILGKVLVVVAAIYAFFLFERLLMICLGKSSHGHAVDEDKSGQHLAAGDQNGSNAMQYQAGNTFELQDLDMPQFSEVDNLDKYSTPPSNSPTDQSIDELPKNIPDSAQYQSHQLTDTLIARQNKEKRSAKFSFTRGMESVSVMVLIGDAVHNITDGIAIGVAFTLDIYVGISTCIAVFCHELPHEIGDFAVFLKNGLSFKTAFFWSLMSNLGGFVGVYIGIALGTMESLHQWIFAATAGMFLYIALVDLMPEITHDPAGFNINVFIMHNVGLVVGWTLMILLAYFESIMSGVVKAPVPEAETPV